MKKGLDPREVGFYRRMLSIPGTEHESTDEVLERMPTRRKLIHNIKWRQLKFLEQVMRKERLENLILTGRLEGKGNRGKQRVT